MEPKRLIILRRFIYQTLGWIDRVLDRKNRLVVFCYHSISSDGWRFTINFVEFQKQMQYLTSRYTPITLSELYQYIRGKRDIKKPSFVLTFDDGYKDILSTQSLLNIYGIKPAVFVLTQRRNINRESLATNRELLTETDIKKMKRLGWEIGSHGSRHFVLTNLGKDELKREIIDSQKKLSQIIGKKVDYFAYPKGKYSQAVLDRMRNSHYRLALTMDDAFITRKTNRFTIPRVGVDGSHSFSEFQVLASPSVIKFRRIIKDSVFGKYI